MNDPSSSLPRTESLAQVGAGDENDSEGAGMRYIDSRFSDTTCGRNFASHAEHVIDLISTLSVVLVAVRLAAVTIPRRICLQAFQHGS